LSKPATGLTLRETPTTRMPNALQRGAKFSAMAPTPKIPTVFFASSTPG
jgi:hypothetical protein